MANYYQDIGNGNLGKFVHIAGSDVMQPVDVQSHYQTSQQIIANVMASPMVGQSPGTVTSAWVDTNGFDRVAVTFSNDAAADSYGDIQWSHDGLNYHSADFGLIPLNSNTKKGIVFETKARYMKVVVANKDTAAPHAMNVWVYLKA